MSFKIKRVSSFYSIFYIIKLNNKIIFIDSGTPSEKRRIEKLNIKPDYVFITHGHWDHIGCVSYLKKSGAKVFIHEKDYEFVKKGIIDLPPSKGSLYSNFVYFLLKFLKNFARFEKFDKDAIELHNLGLKIFETPGHTPGSCTFKIGNNYFIGDTLIGPNPFIKRPRISLFVRNKKELKKTLDFLFELDGRFYPGHGPSFTSELLKKSKDFIWRELKEKN